MEVVRYGTGVVDHLNPGIYILSFNYSDAGNAAQAVTRTVIVEDTTPPVINLNGDANITHEAGSAYHDSNATRADAVDGTGVIVGLGQVNASIPGTYFIVFNLTDSSGNEA